MRYSGVLRHAGQCSFKFNSGLMCKPPCFSMPYRAWALHVHTSCRPVSVLFRLKAQAIGVGAKESYAGLTSAAVCQAAPQ